MAKASITVQNINIKAVAVETKETLMEAFIYRLVTLLARVSETGVSSRTVKAALLILLRQILVLGFISPNHLPGNNFNSSSPASSAALSLSNSIQDSVDGLEHVSGNIFIIKTEAICSLDPLPLLKRCSLAVCSPDNKMDTGPTASRYTSFCF